MDNIVFTIKDIENLVKPIAQKYKVKEIYLFGSYARGEETPESDIDIMVTYLPGTCLGLFGIAKLTESLEALLGKRVDLVEQGSLYPRVANAVESEKIQVYEREP